jgi:hypothetical protein
MEGREGGSFGRAAFTPFLNVASLKQDYQRSLWKVKLELEISPVLSMHARPRDGDEAFYRWLCT